MTLAKQKSSSKNCPSCGAKNSLQKQTFCAECGYFPATSKRVENSGEIEQIKEPSVVGAIIVATGVLVLGIVALLGRIYIWDSGDHYYWMRHLLIVGGAVFVVGHLCAFWYSLVKNGIDLSDVVFGPRSVWGPVLFDMHKKWIVAALGMYGLTLLISGGLLFGVNYESYLGSKSDSSIWKLISDVQTALGNEPTEMPEISFDKLQADINLPTGGDGKLELDGDLSALNPENLTVLVDALGGEHDSSALKIERGSFDDLARSTDISALTGDATEQLELNEVMPSFAASSHSNSEDAPRLHTRRLKRNELECFIFGYTRDEAGELNGVVMGSVVDEKPVYVGLLASEKISAEQLRGIPLEFLMETTPQPFVECKIDATWLKPTAICVVEHQGHDKKGIYILNRFVGFREFL